MGMSVFNEIVSCVKFSFSPSFRAKVSRRKKIKLSGGRKKSEMTCRERRGTKCFICLVQSSCQHLPAYIRRVFFFITLPLCTRRYFYKLSFNKNHFKWNTLCHRDCHHNISSARRRRYFRCIWHGFKPSSRRLQLIKFT